MVATKLFYRNSEFQSTKCEIIGGNAMILIQNWDNQNQQAKSFQMRYNWSKFNRDISNTLCYLYEIEQLELLNHYYKATQGVLTFLLYFKVIKTSA